VKIRNGFVSNSSSSSFIVAYKGGENKPCPTCGRPPIDILDLVGRSEDSDSGIRAEGVEEVLEYYAGWDEVTDRKKEFKKLEKEGWKVVGLSVSYHNETLRDILRSESAIKIIVEAN
jgi:hypothetical protein